jgi:glycerol-3-phosphate acyltransferase PlsY
LALICLASFLCGSLPFGYWAGRLKGIDIREHGSGNIGATNVKRVLGWGPGLIVLALDVAKGFAAALALSFWPEGLNGWPYSDAALAAGLAAFLGHMFTPFLRFKGGKGIATGLGAYLGASWLAGAAALAAFVIVFIPTRWVSLASLFGALAILAVAILYVKTPFFITVTGIAVALVFWKHRSNIQRLIKGEEPRLK